MSPSQVYTHLHEILQAAQQEGNHRLALRALELICKLNGLFDKTDKKLRINELSEEQIQQLIDQLS